MKESFDSSLEGGALVISASSPSAETQAQGFWRVAENSSHIGDYLGFVQPKFPLRPIWWRGESVPDALEERVLSFGFNSVVSSEGESREVTVSAVTGEPHESKTTAEWLLEELKGLPKDQVNYYLLPKTMDPEWLWYITEDVSPNTVLVFDAKWQPMWESLRQQMVATLVPLMPLITDPKEISIISRCYRFNFVGVMLALDQWPSDESELWVAGYSQWWGRDPSLLAATWHKKKP